jgi:Protein of unknown function (DUF2380)
MRSAMAGICWLVFLVCATPVEAAWRIALFDFELINTSLEPTSPDEKSRLAMISGLLREEFAARDDFDFEVLDTTPLAQDIARIGSLHGCNGCELRLAQRIGARFAALGWVQKVSNLILNINLQVREVATGRLIQAGTVDIRGNTDESWRRGLLYLLERRIFRQ